MLQEATDNNVIPFNEDTWKTMKMLKGSLSVMKERNLDGRFNEGIKNDKELLETYIKEYRQ